MHIDRESNSDIERIRSTAPAVKEDLTTCYGIIMESDYLSSHIAVTPPFWKCIKEINLYASVANNTFDVSSKVIGKTHQRLSGGARVDKRALVGAKHDLSSKKYTD